MQSKIFSHWIFLIIATALLAAAFFVAPLAGFFVVVFLLVGLWVLSYHITVGWYVLVALSPLVQWEFSLASVRSFLPDYPSLYSMHAPVAEFWAVALLIAFGINVVRRLQRREAVRLYWPALQWFVLFLGSALLSLVNLPGVERGLGFKYVAHFMLLFYFGYLFLGVNVITSKAMWRKCLVIVVSVASLGALMGLASLFLGVWQGEGFRRAVPFALWGWAPFGDQHIYLAEIITTAVPAILYLYVRTINALNRRALGFLAVGVLTIGLLTLSRAGWLTMVLEGALFWYFTKSAVRFKEMIKAWSWTALIMVPIILYFSWFAITSYTASSSTTSRLYLTDVALFLFRQHPALGQGAGSFPERASEFKAFTMDFSSSIDAHGVVQKILSEQGLVGLVTFGLFLGWIVLTIFRRYRSDEYTAEARQAYCVSLFLVISPLIFQLFNTHYYTSKMWVPIALALAQSVLYKHDTHWIKLQLNLKSHPHHTMEI